MCALPRPLNPTTATRTVLFGLWSALALRAAGNATELRMKCRLSTSVITNLPSAFGRLTRPETLLLRASIRLVAGQSGSFAAGLALRFVVMEPHTWDQ